MDARLLLLLLARLQSVYCSKAKQQARQNAQQNGQSNGSFASGFLTGQLVLAAILFVFIKFFIFGEAPSQDERAQTRAAARRQRTLSHTAARHQRTLSSNFHHRPSSALLKPRPEGGLTARKILEKTYYNVHGHQPESLDWFNVLIAQTISQLRADAQEDEAVLTSLTAVLNGPNKPDFLDEIKVTEISLGEEFPIFSNCRVIPVDEDGMPIRELKGNRGEMLQARMDVDLGDVLTLGIETKLVLNYPKPFVAVLPVALAVSVVRFSGTLSVSFSPSSHPDSYDAPPNQPPVDPMKNEGHPLNPTGSLPTTLTFTFLDDYRLDLSVRSLIGSRSRLQDVPKIAQLVEDRIHRWFDDRCVEPRFQQIVLPSLWPRKKNTRGGQEQTTSGDTASLPSHTHTSPGHDTAVDGFTDTALPATTPRSKKEGSNPTAAAAPPTPCAPKVETAAEQRTRDWAARHGKPKDAMTDLELAGAEMREADERDRERRRKQQQQEYDGDVTATVGAVGGGTPTVGGVRMRTGRDRGREASFRVGVDGGGGGSGTARGVVGSLS